NHFFRGVAAVSANDVWAVGYGAPGTLTERWNGTAWSVVPSRNVGTNTNQLNGVAAVSANDVWAVGQYWTGSYWRALIEHWNGTAWSVLSSLSPGTGDNALN